MKSGEDQRRPSSSTDLSTTETSRITRGTMRCRGNAARLSVSVRSSAGLRDLIREAFALLGASPRLRRSLFFWLSAGLVLSEGFTIPLAVLHGQGSIVPLGLAAAGSWAVASLFLVGGAPLLRCFLAPKQWRAELSAARIRREQWRAKMPERIQLSNQAQVPISQSGESVEELRALALR